MFLFTIFHHITLPDPSNDILRTIYDNKHSFAYSFFARWIRLNICIAWGDQGLRTFGDWWLVGRPKE